MTTKTDNLYSEYPDDFQRPALDQEAHVIDACSGTQALRVQLPVALAEYQTAALALLRIVTAHQTHSSGPSGHVFGTIYAPEFIFDMLKKQLTLEADVACENAARRVYNAEYGARTRWNDIIQATQRSQRMMPLQEAAPDGH